MSDKNDTALEALYEVPRRLVRLLGNPDSTNFLPGIAVMAWHDRQVLAVGCRTLTETGSTVSVNIGCPEDLQTDIQKLMADLKIEIEVGARHWTPTSISTMLSSERKDQTVLSILEDTQESWSDVLTHVGRAGQDWLDVVDHQKREVTTLVYLNSKIEAINTDLFRLLVQKGLRKPGVDKSERTWYAVKKITDERGKPLLWSRCILTGDLISYTEGAHHPAGCYHLECNKQPSERIVWVKSLHDALDPHEGSNRRHPKSVKTHFTTDGVLSHCRNVKGRPLTRISSEVTCKSCQKKMSRNH